MKKYLGIGGCLLLIIIISEANGADGVLPLILMGLFVLCFIYAVVWVIKKAWKS